LHLGASTLGIAKIVVIINGLLYLSSAILVGTRIPELSKRDPTQTQAVDRAAPREGKSGFFQMFSDGFRFAMSTPLVRGLIIGMVGAFAAGGAAIGTARQYALSLLGGESTIGLLFLSLFVGLAIGMVGAPKLAARMSHNRIFGLAIVAAGMLLALAALSPQLAISLLLVALVGGCAGVAFLTGVTIIGSQVADAMRGRVNAVYQSLMKIILFASTVVVPLLVSLVHPHTITLFHRQMTIDGTRPVLLGAGLLAAVFGLFAYRQMGDRSTEPILSNLLRVVRGTDKRTSGVLLAVEGEVASDNSARAAQIGQWLAEAGYRVVLAGDPTVEELRMRAALGEAQLSSTRAIALMAAAFRADLVERRIRPALNSGAVVIMERYLDTPLAHLGALGGVPAEEVESVVDWATGHLRADLTVLIEHSPPAEVPPESTVSRRFGAEHRWRVQSLLADMASADPERYLVIDAHSEPTPTAELIRDRVAAVLRRRHRRAERDDQHAAALSANGVPGMHEDTGH
ncbi:MAG: dTMP kinase, partial [Sciscionella sp.]